VHVLEALSTGRLNANNARAARSVTWMLSCGLHGCWECLTLSQELYYNFFVKIRKKKFRKPRHTKKVIKI